MIGKGHDDDLIFSFPPLFSFCFNVQFKTFRDCISPSLSLHPNAFNSEIEKAFGELLETKHTKNTDDVCLQI